MKTLFTSLKITLTFCVILFVGYVLVLWGFALVVTPNAGQAEVVKSGQQIVGVANVGQQFTAPEYFWPRPSAVDYNGSGSGGSNKGPSNPAYLAQVAARIDTFMLAHPYLTRNQVPAEMVTSSASGLDPDISPAAAAVQIQRVATARTMTTQEVTQIVQQHTVTPLIGVPYINVLKLNVALDSQKQN